MKEKVFVRRTMVFVVTIISVLFLGVMDYITGWEFGFFVFYFIPIALSAWLLGIRYSIGISILSSIVWFISDYYSGYPYSSVLFRYWNAGIRFLSFLSISFSISYYQLLIKERLLSQELKESLGNVKTLSGLIPICAACKKIRDDEGYWKQVEEYVGEHTEAQFSHGLCPDCYQKYRKEAGIGRGVAI